MLKNSIFWKETLNEVTDYNLAVTEMEKMVSAIRDEVKPELVWFLQHPPIYTAGTAAAKSELLDPARFPVFETGRGGRYTYHGPGQLIAYTLIDLKKRNNDIRTYIYELEQWIIDTLAEFNIVGQRRKGRVGIWVVKQTDDNKQKLETKIAAIGVRVRKWVTYHGISININPDLRHYSGIVPCGIKEHGVTSLLDLGVKTDMTEVTYFLKKNFQSVFGYQTEDRYNDF